MDLVAGVLVAVVAVLHMFFAYLEMVAWKTPRAQEAFGTTPQQAEDTAVLAANQGLYNLFVAFGLWWGVFATGDAGLEFRCVFLGFVIVAGVFGAVTVSRRILLVQSLPAAVALVAVLVAR
jgi:putative membrane protein